MRKYLVTGVSGFVGRHFLRLLDGKREASDVLGVDAQEEKRDEPGYQRVKYRFAPLNLLDEARLSGVLRDFEPDYILHLASFSSVSFSWENPALSFRNNTNILLNLVEAIRAQQLKCRLLSIGSSEEYGSLVGDGRLDESAQLAPTNPYAVARVSQEMISRVYVGGFGLDIVLTRSFNHVGPGQREAFAVASFAKQLVHAWRRGERRAVFHTGDIDVIRDFVDVRDVARAYDLLFTSGHRGEVYNVCSGAGVRLRDIIERMGRLLDIEVHPVTDSQRIRPTDSKCVVGSNAKIRAHVGWVPNYDLDTSLRDVVEHLKQQV